MTLKQILDPYVDKSQNGSRKSLARTHILPDDVKEISTYLKFVHREDQVKQLLQHMVKLHEIAQGCHSYIEPRKYIVFPTVSGTAGKGKTTFARRAYDIRSSIFASGFKIPEKTENAIEECLSNFRSFRVSCDSFSKDDICSGNEEIFGKVLLYEALKYQLK